MKFRNTIMCFWVPVALFFFCSNTVAGQRPFLESSLMAIEQKYAGVTFLLVVWSIDCPPCRDELALLGELHRELKEAGRSFNLVLVATDNINQQKEINAIITGYGLEHTDSWAFANDNIAKLRYALDPDWFGELPRSYFYDAALNRNAVSGKLTKNRVVQWVFSTMAVSME